jgi:uncharacterized protein YbaR (Trm112 family)
MVKQELLDILICPKCKEKLRYNKEPEALICDSCRLVFWVREDIPIMLVDEATSLDDFKKINFLRSRYNEVIPVQQP